MNPSFDELQSAFARLLAATAPPGQTSDVAATAPELDPLVPTRSAPPENVRSQQPRLEVKVAPNQVVAAAQLLDQHGFAMDTITGVDWLATGEMEVVYDFYHPTAPLHAVVRTRVPRAQPELPTIAGVFPGANWHERETHEFFGIEFRGHPNLTPLLLPEDAAYHPLRKDFAGVA